jgi:hypothetical protein
MHSVIGRPHIGHQNIGDYAWTLPALIVVLVVGGAIASLFTGLITPDVIGADGLSSSLAMGVP